MSIPFFTTNTKILLNNQYIMEIFPNSNMEYNQKLNAISRLIILLSLLALIFTRNISFFIIGIIGLIAIYILFINQSKPKLTKENFQNIINDDMIPIQNKEITPDTLKQFMKNDFQMGDKKNPFGNVLLTDIGDHPERKSAPPAFNPDVYEDITRSTKKLVQTLNPEIKNTNKQLFGSLSDNFYLDQSNRNFFSTANTRVTNDQGAYAKFLYGNMPSGKESGLQRIQDNPRYTLY
jgi:hypothetical protein